MTFGAVMAYLLNNAGVFGVRLHLIPATVIVILICGGGVGCSTARCGGQCVVEAQVWLQPSWFRSVFDLLQIRHFVHLQRPTKRLRDYQIQEQWDLGLFRLAPKDLVLMIISVSVLVGVASALQFTRMGKAMRAVSDNRDLAESTGIDVERVISMVWIFGSALAGLGGVLFGLTESINWEMGFRILLLMFAGVTLGGLGTAYGALFGSIIVGLFIQLSTLVIPTDMKNVGALLMLIVILLIRPQGLFGRRERIDRRERKWIGEQSSRTRSAVHRGAVYLFLVAAMGLNMHYGYTGLLNFGQAVFRQPAPTAFRWLSSHLAQLLVGPASWHRDFSAATSAHYGCTNAAVACGLSRHRHHCR